MSQSRQTYLTNHTILAGACATVLWAYMASLYVYKIWYIATALAVWTTTLLVLRRQVRLGRLLSALTFPCLYFWYWLLTTFWAPAPYDTLWWVAIDAIALVVFALFYVCAQNVHAATLRDLWVGCTVPGLLVTVFTYLHNPEAIRAGGYAPAVLPLAIPFCWLRVLHGPRRGRAGAALSVILALLIVSSSRTPLLVAGLLCLWAPWAFSHRLGVALRAYLCGLLGVVVMLSVVFAIPVTRTLALRTVGRIIVADVLVGEEEVLAERPDIVRQAINQEAAAAWWTYGLFGMGYLQFGASWFAVRYPDWGVMHLHRSLHTWGIEGGVPCLVIVWLLLGQHVRGLWYTRGRARTGVERDVSTALLMVTTGLLLMSWFHQVHRIPTFWAVLGMGLGLTHRTGWARPPANALFKRG